MSTIVPQQLFGGFISGTIPVMAPGDIQGKRAVGERLEIVRRSLKISQEVLCERIEPLLPPHERPMTISKWGNYVKGRDWIPPLTATALCIISGVDLDYIYRNLWGGMAPDVQDRLHEAINNPQTRFRRPRRP